jgi:hypothetical protein
MNLNLNNPSEEEIDETLAKIEPNVEDYIDRRINHKSFAKIIIWLYSQYVKKQDFVYASELSKFMKFTQTRAYIVLNELCRAGIMRKKEKSSNLIEFYFVMNSEKPIICKFINKAMKTLDLQ